MLTLYKCYQSTVLVLFSRRECFHHDVTKLYNQISDVQSFTVRDTTMVALAKMSGQKKPLFICCHMHLFPIFFSIQTTTTQAIRRFTKEKGTGPS